MIRLGSKFQPLGWYKSENDRFIAYCDECNAYVQAYNSNLIPFQFVVDAATVVSNLQVNGYCNSTTVGPPRGGLSVTTFQPNGSSTTMTAYSYNGSLGVSLADGLYYYTVQINGVTHYSDVFKVCAPLTNHSWQISWRNSCNMDNLVYSGGFTNWLYLENNIPVKPEFKLKKDGKENGFGQFQATNQRLQKYYQLSIIVPDHALEAFYAMQMHDTIFLRQVGSINQTVTTYEIENIEVSDSGDLQDCTHELLLKFTVKLDELNAEKCCTSSYDGSPYPDPCATTPQPDPCAGVGLSLNAPTLANGSPINAVVTGCNGTSSIGWTYTNTLGQTSVLGTGSTVTISGYGIYEATLNCNGCIVKDAIIVQDPCALLLNASLVGSTISANVTNCANPVFVWKYKATGQATFTTISNTTSVYSAAQNYGDYQITVTCGAGCTKTVVINYPDPCNGAFVVATQPTPNSLTATVVGLGACVPVYLWKLNGNNIGIGQSISVSAAGTYEVLVSGCGDCVLSDTITIGTPCASVISATITENAAGTQLTATPAGCTGITAYSWTYKADNNVSEITIGSAATVNIQGNGLYTVTVTCAGCVVTKQYIVIDCAQITACGSLSVGIVKSGNTLTAVASGCTSTPTFTWFFNNGTSGWVQQSTVGTTFTATTNGMYRVVMTCGTCPEVVAEYLVMNCDPCNLVQVTLSQTATQIITTVTGCPVGTTPTYEWYIDTGDGYQLVSFSIPTITPPISGIYKVVVTCGTCVTEEAILFCLPSCFVNVTATNNNCTLTATATVTGCTGSVLYQWFLNGTAITGATNMTYAATQNGSYYVVASCSSDPNCTSQSVALNVTCPPCSITAAPTVSGCVITANATAVNCSGTLTYQWQSLSGTTWSNIAGATAATYTPTANGSFRVIVRCSTLTTCTVTSAAVSITCVGAACVASVTASVSAACVLTAAATLTGCSGVALYQWQSLSGTIWSNITGATAATYTPTANTQYRVIVRCSTLATCTATSTAVNVTCVCNATASIAVSANSCQLISSTTNCAGTPIYRWYLNSVLQSAFNNQAAITPTTTGNWYVVVTCGTCTVTSNTINFTVPNPGTNATLSTCETAGIIDLNSLLGGTSSTAWTASPVPAGGGFNASNGTYDPSFADVSAVGGSQVFVFTRIVCGQSRTVTVTVSDAPNNPTINTNATTCTSVNLTALLPSGMPTNGTWRMFGYSAACSVYSNATVSVNGAAAASFAPLAVLGANPMTLSNFGGTGCYNVYYSYTSGACTVTQLVNINVAACATLRNYKGCTTGVGIYESVTSITIGGTNILTTSYNLTIASDQTALKNAIDAYLAANGYGGTAVVTDDGRGGYCVLINNTSAVLDTITFIDIPQPPLTQIPTCVGKFSTPTRFCTYTYTVPLLGSSTNVYGMVMNGVNYTVNFPGQDLATAAGRSSFVAVVQNIITTAGGTYSSVTTTVSGSNVVIAISGTNMAFGLLTIWVSNVATATTYTCPTFSACNF